MIVVVVVLWRIGIGVGVGVGGGWLLFSTLLVVVVVGRWFLIGIGCMWRLDLRSHIHHLLH